MSSYYPVSLKLSGQPCVVVGGGRVAERKVTGLLESGAEVRVISPRVTDLLRGLAESGQISLTERPFEPRDLDGAFAVIAAAGDRKVNRLVAEAAGERHQLVNVVDTPQLCNFIVPATLRRGDLTIAISTAGRSPALARQVREDLEAFLPAEYGQDLERIAAIREDLRQLLPNAEARQAAWRTLMSDGLVQLLRAGNAAAVDDLVAHAVALSQVGQKDGGEHKKRRPGDDAGAQSS